MSHNDGSNEQQKQDWFDGRKILESIRAESARRRAAPLDFFCVFLRDIWLDNTPEEALRQWQNIVAHFPWYADDALYCLNAVIAQPPPNLEDILSECGWIELVHPPKSDDNDNGQQGQSEVRPYTFDELVEWLVQLREQYQAVFNSAITPLPDMSDDTDD